jgi:hypothetical protein
VKPSEYVNLWANAAAENYKDGMPIDESLMAARIVALLEAVEGARKIMPMSDPKVGNPSPGSIATEALAEAFHNVYQAEAKRQGDVRHKDAYADLPENIKEYDRVLARYVLAMFAPGSISREDEDALNTYCETMLHAYFTRRRNDGLEKAETEADKDYAAIAHLRAALALREK